MRYRILTPLRRDGKTIGEGRTFDLDPEEAAPLVELAAIVALDGDEPDSESEENVPPKQTKAPARSRKAAA